MYILWQQSGKKDEVREKLYKDRDKKGHIERKVTCRQMEGVRTYFSLH